MPDEFDCVDCGRHIVVFPHDVMSYRMCGACMTIPGWWKVPELAEKLDPEHDRTVDDETRRGEE